MFSRRNSVGRRGTFMVTEIWSTFAYKSKNAITIYIPTYIQFFTHITVY